ncbi:hypothetical protein DICA3_E00518 [Diutina catenulata]
MVSFSCESCNETLLKKKCQQHTQRCPGAVFTCIDCYKTFPNGTYAQHTSCITEAQKVEGKLWKPKQKGQTKGQQKGEAKKAQPEAAKKVEAEKKEMKKDKKSKKSKKESKDEMSVASFYSKGDDLYKVVKKASKAQGKELKQVLKTLKVELKDGQLVVDI